MKEREDVKRMKERLGKLFLYDVNELDWPEESPLNLNSVVRFLEFWLEYQEQLIAPSLTVSNDGNIKAVWAKDDNGVFWMEFWPWEQGQNPNNILYLINTLGTQKCFYEMTDDLNDIISDFNLTWITRKDEK